MESQTDWFKPLCIFALVLGIAGMCCDLFSIGSLFLTDSMANLNEQLRAAAEAQRPYRPWMLLLGAAQIVQSFALALGAGLSLRDVQRHGRILVLALKGGLVIAPLALAVGVIIQLTSKAGEVQHANLPENFGGIVRWFSVLAGTGWVAVKMAFFVVTLRAVQKQLQGGAPAP